MRLEGIHHITAITGDGQRCVDFYVGVLGLRFVKRTVNFDAPDAYHLYFGDELGHPGSILTFFEFRGVAPGRAGAGMIHRIAWRVRNAEALDFWAERLSEVGTEVERDGLSLRFADPEGLGHELVVDASGDEFLIADSPAVPVEPALRGFDGVRAYSRAPATSDGLLAGKLGLAGSGESGYRAEGEERHAHYAYDEAPGGRPLQGAGTVHHIAWASRDGDHEAWRERALEGGARVTPIIDRKYFHSIYFREPSGVLFEIATLGPGFTVDESAERLGEALQLPDQLEPRRPELERHLTPIVDPRSAVR